MSTHISVAHTAHLGRQAHLFKDEMGKLALSNLRLVVGHMPRLARRFVALAQDDQDLAKVADEAILASLLSNEQV